MYTCNPVKADMVIVDPSAWVFAGTGLQPGARVPDLVGSEYDRYDPNLPGPRNIQILAHSPLTCRNQQDHSDMTYYTAPGGGGVFATGTNVWVAALENACPAGTSPCASDVTQRVTENVLAAERDATARHVDQDTRPRRVTAGGGAGPSRAGLSSARRPPGGR